MRKAKAEQKRRTARMVRGALKRRGYDREEAAKVLRSKKLVRP